MSHSKQTAPSAPQRTGVLPTGSNRLVISAGMLQRLVDTALALEAEVDHLRLKAVFDAPAAAEPPAATD